MRCELGNEIELRAAIDLLISQTYLFGIRSMPSLSIFFFSDWDMHSCVILAEPLN